MKNDGLFSFINGFRGSHISIICVEVIWNLRLMGNFLKWIKKWDIIGVS